MLDFCNSGFIIYLLFFTIFTNEKYVCYFPNEKLKYIIFLVSHTLELEVPYRYCSPMVFQSGTKPKLQNFGPERPGPAHIGIKIGLSIWNFPIPIQWRKVRNKRKFPTFCIQYRMVFFFFTNISHEQSF